MFDLPRHRWYVIKEAFSPELLSLAVCDASLEKKSIVIDPFCGSGTVPVAASLRGYRSMGIEVNPFLAFVARTKLSNCSPRSLDSAVASVMSSIRQGAPSPLEGFSTFSRQPKAEKWLFNRSILRSYEGGWRASESVRGPAKDVIRLMLVRAAMENCNAVADGKCLRYRSDWETSHFGRETSWTALSHGRSERFDRISSNARFLMTEHQSLPETRDAF